MKKLFSFIILLLLCASASAQDSTPNAKTVRVGVTNASPTGTTLNRLAKLTGAPSKAVIAATTDTDGVIGVVVGGAGTSGVATVQTAGQANCDFDGATTAGDYVSISSTSAGKCHDAGGSFPSGGQVVGRVLATNGGAGTYPILLQPGAGATGGAVNPTSGTVAYNNSGSLADSPLKVSGANVYLPATSSYLFGTDGNGVGYTDAVGPRFADEATSHTLTFNLQSLTADRMVFLPNAAGTLVLDSATQTLTNKTLTSPVINTPTGITKSDVGLSAVTNDAQTKAAIVPNTAPAAGQVPVGNAGGTAYAPQSVSGDGSLSSAGALTVTKSNGVAFGANAFNSTTYEPSASVPVDAVALLATVNGADLNTTSATNLYTCPTGKSCIVHRVIVYNASTSLTTASYAFGWTSPNFNDVVANGTHTELTTSTVFTIMNAKTASTIGTAGQVFKIKPTIAQGAAATVSIQVWGNVY
jgi:hypothetical protein